MSATTKLYRLGGGRLNARDVVEEVEWLLGGGVHPDIAARQLNTNRAALARRLTRYGRHDLAKRFEPHSSERAA